MTAEARRGEDDGGARMKLLCSHGGRLVPRASDGALRYVGGETRVLVVPRAVSFHDLAARLAEMAGGAEVRAVRHRLADDEDVLVSVTCDEELAHMRDEYDRLRTTRPTAGFRVFVITTTASGISGGGGAQRRRTAPGLPPLAPKVRCVQSEQALAARAQLHRRAASPAPMRRVQSAQELACASRLQPSFHHGGHQGRCDCQRRDLCSPTPPPEWPMYASAYVSKNANGVRSGRQQAAPAVSPAKATGPVFTEAAKEKARCRDVEVAMEKGRAIWEFE